MSKLKVELTNITPNSEVHCEKNARDCYNSISKMKDPNKPSKLIKGCTKADHLTVNGHSMASFRITGVSRATMAQITRTRTACFSIRSQRYVNELDFEYILPDSIRDNPKAEKLYTDVMNEINNTYSNLLALGVKKEDARMVLPNACETVINMSASYEGWLHFLRRRMDVKTQWEAREVAFEIYRALNKEAPLIFNEDTLTAPRVPNIDFSKV